MGSVPSEDVVRALEREAYAALLRAIYANPHANADPLSIDAFLTKAREHLRITNHANILEAVRADLERIRQGQRITQGTGTPIQSGPIGAPGGARAKSRASGYKTPSTGGKGRSRAMRSAGSVDSQGLVGRRIWRYYPDENPEQPWVEGFLTDYDTNSQTYTILYDPNDPGLKETTEFGFDLNSTNPVRNIKDIILLENYAERTLIAVFYVCRVNMF